MLKRVKSHEQYCILKDIRWKFKKKKTQMKSLLLETILGLYWDINFLMWATNQSKQGRLKARNNACPW